MSKNLWDKIWRDRHGQVVIYQRPNVWLITWAVFDGVSLLAPHGQIESVSWALGSVALAIWAGLEIVQGVNYFRRGLGLMVLVLTLSSALGVGL